MKITTYYRYRDSNGLILISGHLLDSKDVHYLNKIFCVPSSNQLTSVSKPEKIGDIVCGIDGHHLKIVAIPKTL